MVLDLKQYSIFSLNISLYNEQKYNNCFHLHNSCLFHPCLICQFRPFVNNCFQWQVIFASNVAEDYEIMIIHSCRVEYISWIRICFVNQWTEINALISIWRTSSYCNWRYLSPQREISYIKSLLIFLDDII